MSEITVEFLEVNQFKPKAFDDGVYWIRYYKADSYIQVSPCFTHILEEDNGWVEELTVQEFYDIVAANQKAIDQE